MDRLLGGKQLYDQDEVSKSTTRDAADHSAQDYFDKSKMWLNDYTDQTDHDESQCSNDSGRGYIHRQEIHTIIPKLRVAQQEGIECDEANSDKP